MDRPTVMIVEDKAMVAEDCRDCLENLGYYVTSMVASGEESIEKADTDRPDVVVMDIHLRDKMTGIEAAEQIYDRYGIPVVFLSAYSDAKLLEQAKRVGAFGYLVKPFEERELFATLETVLHKVKADAAILASSRMEATATLAGGIAHDYNNLMTVVLGYAELVRNNLGEDHPDADMLREIGDAAQSASDLAQRLLAFAQEGVRLMKELNLNQVVDETLRVQGRKIGPGIEVVCDLDTPLGVIKADRAQMEMVLTSLYDNAIEAIDGDGEIRVRTRNVYVDDKTDDKRNKLKPGRYVVLSVEDTGCGMSEDILKRVYEPFFSTKFQGRGLGLASTYGIVKNHGGHIVFDSEEGTGTACSIHFPAVEIKLEEKSKVPMPVAATETILVVDDEVAILNVMSMMLTRLGYEVLTANSGQSSIDLVRKHEGSIDVVLLDMSMPVMDGMTTFTLLKKVRPEIKVILFSGYEYDGSTKAVLDAGADSFLQKPVMSQKLAKEVRKVLDSR